MHNGKSTVTRKSVEALAAELQAQGFDDLAADVAFGPIAVAASATIATQVGSSHHVQHSTDIDDDASLDDVLEDSDSEDEDNAEYCDEEDADSFDEVLDDELDEDEADTASGSTISAVIVDPNRKYSKQELKTLRMVATTCIEQNHHIPNAKALLKSLDAYESQQQH